MGVGREGVSEGKPRFPPAGRREEAHQPFGPMLQKQIQSSSASARASASHLCVSLVRVCVAASAVRRRRLFSRAAVRNLSWTRESAGAGADRASAAPL